MKLFGYSVDTTEIPSYPCESLMQYKQELCLALEDDRQFLDFIYSDALI